jgi:hypothetical protein
MGYTAAIDLRGLFVLKWDEFDNHIRFPLHAPEGSEV